MVCSTDRSKAVVPVLVFLLVALWFILRGDLLYVFPCVILFLCFSILLVLRLPRLGKRELILVLFVRLFGLCLFRFVGFLFLLGSGKGCGLWLWHSLDFSLTFFFLISNSFTAIDKLARKLGFPDLSLYLKVCCGLSNFCLFVCLFAYWSEKKMLCSALSSALSGDPERLRMNTCTHLRHYTRN